MSLYDPPLFMLLDPLAAHESPWLRAPLPFPGVPLQREIAAVGLRGSGHFGQIKEIGEYLYPESNICGTLSYRRRDSRFKNVKYGESGSWDQWQTEYDYTFVDERDEDYVDPVTGKHEDQWKPVVKFGAVVDSHTGPTPFHPIYWDGKSAFRAEWWRMVADEEGGEVKEDLGEMVLSNVVNHTYLFSRIRQWESLPSSARRRTKAAGYYGYTIATSESEEGLYCYATGGQWHVPLNLAESVGTAKDVYLYERGWAGGVKVNIPHTHRKNGAVLHDNKRQRVGDDIFNLAVSEAMLGDEITSRRWMDDCGTYDPAGDSAFSGMGWRPMPVDNLASRVVNVPPAGRGGVSKGVLISADGGIYRVTLEAKGYEQGADQIKLLKTAVINVTPTMPGVFDLRLPEASTSMVNWVSVLSIERQRDGAGWQALTGDLESMISNMPGAGVVLLCIAKARRGKRWGFPQYYEAGLPQEAVQYGIYQSGEMRFFRRQMFRHKSKARTEGS